MKRIYQKYLKETLDSSGALQSVKFDIPDDFNFGFDVVDEIARVSPEKKALIYLNHEKNEKTFSFKDMSVMSNKTANFFTDIGIKKGDKVLVILRRNYEFWFTILALHKMNAVIIPATDQLKKKDIEYRIKAAEVSAIVCTGESSMLNEVVEAVKEFPNIIKIIARGEKEDFYSFDKGIEKASDIFIPKERNKATDPALMYFTSGTTGYPKIAVHSHTYSIGHIMTGIWWHNVEPDGVHFTISESGWGKFAWGKIYGQWFGESAVFAYDFDRFHAEDILPLFKKYNITTFCAPPTMYRFFIKEDLKKFDLSTIHYANTAGEALNPEVFKKFYEATGLEIKEGFGQTETTLTLGTLIGMKVKPGSMGKPNPQYEIDLVDENGHTVASGVTGEIVVKTENGCAPGMFLGYYNHKELTNEAWHDGLYHTGDTAWRDEDGYYWYVGRTDDMIKSSGYRIGPFEIESVIMELPYVLECAVIGVPDAVRGQIVKAVIVLRGKEPSEELTKEIQDYVKKNTAPYKYPREVEYREALPKTISGKIIRKDLK